MKKKLVIPNIKNLNKDLNRNIKQDNKVYDSVLEDCIQNIKDSINLRKSFLYYKIPQYINIGFNDDYNVYNCINYVKDILQKNNYKVKYQAPYSLFIDWST